MVGGGLWMVGGVLWVGGGGLWVFEWWEENCGRWRVVDGRRRVVSSG